MPFSRVCCCPQHDAWGFGQVSRKKLFSLSDQETFHAIFILKHCHFQLPGDNSPKSGEATFAGKKTR